MPAGRPTGFKPAFAGQAQKLARLGATDAEIADVFGISVRTLHRWKAEHREFCHSLKAGKDEADIRVERSLYQRAVGFEHDAVRIFMPAGAKEPVLVPYREYLPPDTTACIFWLKNRKPDEWREKLDLNHSGSVELAERIANARKRSEDAS